ncbi:MAG: hypothetical protein ABRQ37_22150, partial [Candidatus Eremiobacterota bacterium]
IAIISVLLLTVLLSMLTVSMVFISTNHLSMMGNSEQKMKALKAAEAAAEYALARLNKEPAWGAGTPSSTDNAKKDLDGSSWEINFTGSEYLSCNNLQGTNKVDRSAIGDTKLYGTIPAYTAEFICKGKAGNTIKYVKVIFIRSDISPYALDAQGKIYLAEGNVTIKDITFDPNGKSPGRIYSAWDPVKEGEDPNTSFSIEQADLLGTKVDLQGGTASAAGKIRLNEDPNKVVLKENLSSEEPREKNMEAGKIIDEKKSSCTPDVKPGSFLITPLYYIPNDPQKMADILNRTSQNKLLAVAQTEVPLPTDAATAAANANINISNWDNVQYTAGYKTMAYTSAIGVTQDIRKDLPGFSDANFPIGWDIIEGTNMQVQIGVTVKGTEEVSDPKWYNPFNTSTENRNGANNYTRTAAIPTGATTFQLSPNNNSYFTPPTDLLDNGLLDGEQNIGLAKIGADKKIEKFLPPNYANNDLGISTDFKITDKGSDNYEIEGAFQLERDIYINSTPASDPGKTLLELAGTPDNPIVKDTIFRIMGVPYEVSGRKYKLNTSMNLNDHSIYSDAHLIIGVNVEGNGDMVSRGKIAYLHKGINSDSMASISDDDLIIQTAPGSNYNINGFLFSNDDVIIEKAEPNSPLGGAILMGTETAADYVNISGSITSINKNQYPHDADPNNSNKSINITGIRNKNIIHSDKGWDRLAKLRENKFNVRMMSWFELN